MNKRQAADKHNYERWLRLNARPEQRLTKRQKRRVGVIGGRRSRAMVANALGGLI